MNRPAQLVEQRTWWSERRPDRAGLAIAGPHRARFEPSRAGLELGRESLHRTRGDLAPGGCLGQVERLDPHRIHRQHQPPAGEIEQGDREHPIEPVREGEPMALVEPMDHLAIGPGGEREPGAYELGA